MAEGGPSPELDEHLLKCPICLERLRQPKSLPCLHSFCQECLGTYITKELSGKMALATSFPCPVCRRMTQTVNQTVSKDKWAEQFPINAVIQELIQLKDRSSEPLYCKPCQTRGSLTIPAKFWCKSMGVKFCDTCKIQHHDIMHNECDILDITGYDSRTTKQEKSVPKCDQHDDKLIWYCEDDKRLGCNICMIKDHRRCEEVTTAVEYLQKLKTGSQLEEMEMALKKGAHAMTSLLKDFDEQIQSMVQNQEIALQSIKALRQSVEEQLNKLQKDVTDKLITMFKEEKGNMEASSRQCERLMNSMFNTQKSSVTAAEGNNAIETIVLYQRGQAEVESCKALVTEMSKSFRFVSIKHQIVHRMVTIGDDAMGKIIIERQQRFLPDDFDYLSVPLSDRRVKEIGKFNVKTSSDKERCWLRGVVYLPNEQIVLSDYNNKKLRVFTDKGQYLDELVIRGNPSDLCLVKNNTVAVAVNSPGGVCVVQVEDSKFFLSSEINISNGKDCIGITHRDGKFIVGTRGGEVYSVTQDGTAELLHKYNNSCYTLTQDPVKGDTIVSVNNNNTEDVVVSRLSADKLHTDVMKVGVVRDVEGIDIDREGNIYVCGNSSHNVVQMSGDGTHVRELMTSSEGMKSPQAIAVRGTMFVVTSWGSTDQDSCIQVFQLYYVALTSRKPTTTSECKTPTDDAFDSTGRNDTANRNRPSLRKGRTKTKKTPSGRRSSTDAANIVTTPSLRSALAVTMAEGGPSPELDEHLLECPICLEQLRQPKSLPCLHSFCQECLGTYITKKLSGKMALATSFPCPICRRMTYTLNQTEAKDKWAEQFPTNAVIQDLIKLQEHSSEPLYCKPCQTRGNLTNLAKFWCKIMNLYLCETCKVQHHDVLHYECDILDITGYDSRKKKHEKSVPKCDQHDKKLIWYCEDHKRLGCNICMINDHMRCEEVTTAVEYLQKLKAGSQLEEMEMALKIGVQAMTSLVKDFDEQLKTLVQNQEIALQSITDLRQSVEEQLNKLQKDVTDKLIILFKEVKGNIEASSRQSERLMNSMVNTMKSSITAAEENDTFEAIVLYQRGQAEVESYKALVTEMSTSVTINHQIVPRLVTLGDDAMGKIVIERRRRCLPGDLEYQSVPLSERSVKEIGKCNVKTPSDKSDCSICGIVYLPNAQIVLSDYNNKKLKLFTDKGKYLDVLPFLGNPCDLCLVNNNTVAVAVTSPGGVRVVNVEHSKLSLSSKISMPNVTYCYGITHSNGRFIVSTLGGQVYSVTQDGATELLHKYNNTCYCLTQDPVKGDTLVSVYNNTEGKVAVSRLSADKRHTDVMKVGVVSGVRGIHVDREGFIYVCGKDSHNVVQMLGDGTHVRDLLTSSDGVKYPYAIFVRGDTFVVTSCGSADQDNYIRIFQLYLTCSTEKHVDG
ncbi:uncharacterized protein LOC110465969 [Mizuhopecten yessoensis]|uniref:uncharacterized protein LOC110465969 n=1 Tax=Mizuhopecten yessoensis TaxID=6573 RepID=UPI000B459FA8|nr:uncharacterized protein LOC110465969 [Mizuhopecten yessoensis]